jgi:hypothetical protein
MQQSLLDGLVYLDMNTVALSSLQNQLLMYLGGNYCYDKRLIPPPGVGKPKQTWTLNF